jgi:DNA polymerase I-like protein with 3'-5' exonuclease and polymerase domains
MMLGIIFRQFKDRKGVLMLNTIHDSLMFDVEGKELIEFILDIQEVLRDTHKYFQQTFKHPLALKLNAGASYGLNWYQMEEVD